MAYLKHYGMPRRSGRYPWGSGEDPYQHSRDFVGRYNELEKTGLSHDEIIKAMGLSSTKYRALNAIALNERRMYDVATAESLRKDGLNNTEIARRMGLPSESSVRSLLDEGAKNRMSQSLNTANRLKDIIAAKGVIDVGPGVERDLGVSPEKLKVAEEILIQEGYSVLPFRVKQVNNPGKWTTVKALAPPGMEYKDVFALADKGEIATAIDYESTPITEGVPAKKSFKYPTSIDGDRVKIRYADEKAPDGHTGVERDGLIEIRPGVEDLSLGNNHYAQVRILVDGDRYIKGMAVYSNNIPDGYDIVVNSNKPEGTAKRDVLKKIKSDPDNPFGALIKEDGQSMYVDSKTGETKLSAINMKSSEGDWDEWSRNLPSQFLGKQKLDLIKKQINTSIADKEAQYEEICNLTNPTLKKQLLNDFAEDCDSSAVYLKAAALPRQRYQVLVPVASMKDNEVYAPNFNDGEIVSLVRFPHGGTFEMPQLRVNNKNKEAKEMFSEAPKDAVGVNKKIADQLSGADFDGDTVLVIPTNSKVRITAQPPLEGLKGFDTKSYQYDEPVRIDSEGNEHYYRNGREFRVMKDTQKQMGVISNLITDMTIKGADSDELARAVRHSMVVIDAEKHKLDYKQSELDNNIKELKQIYQDGGGASTLLSLAKSEVRVDKRQGMPKVNLEYNSKGEKNDFYDPDRPEGALIWKTVPDKELYYTTKKTNKKGEVVEEVHKRTQISTRMAETDDAMSLVSNPSTSPKEVEYANYANKLKSLANQARVEISKTGKIAYDKAAAREYSKEVEDLKSQLDVAKRNAPRERQANLLANSVAKAKQQDNPSMTREEYKKIAQQELTRAREKLGAKKIKIQITDREWEAIQKGAVSENVLKDILKNTDSDALVKRAMPRQSRELSSAKVNSIKAKYASGYTAAEIAKDLGVSASTVLKYLKE